MTTLKKDCFWPKKDNFYHFIIRLLIFNIIGALIFIPNISSEIDTIFLINCLGDPYYYKFTIVLLTSIILTCVTRPETINRDKNNLINFILVSIIIVDIITFFTLFSRFITTSSDLYDYWYDESGIWYYLLITFVTSIIALIANIQLTHINEKVTTEYLLKIDERWCNKEMVKARKIIHHMSLKKSKSQRYIPKKILYDRVGRQIYKISKEKEKEIEFMLVLNFLDFLETIGYLHQKNKLRKKDLDELCGDSLVKYYKYFKYYIRFIREDENNPKLYQGFESLYKDLIPKK